MSGKGAPVFGIYNNRAGAEQGVHRLLECSYRNEDISVLLQDNVGTKDLAHEKQNKPPEGPAIGVVAGGVVGGTLGLLAGIGALAVPGSGPLIAAGAIMERLASMGAGGVVGGIVGAVAGFGIPEYEAKRYMGRIKEGDILLAVHCDNGDSITKAKEILRQTGAEEVFSTGGEVSTDYAESNERLAGGTGPDRAEGR